MCRLIHEYEGICVGICVYACMFKAAPTRRYSERMKRLLLNPRVSQMVTNLSLGALAGIQVDAEHVLAMTQPEKPLPGLLNRSLSTTRSEGQVNQSITMPVSRISIPARSKQVDHWQRP